MSRMVNKKGQSLADFAIMFGAVAMAIYFMWGYVLGSIGGRLHRAEEELNWRRAPILKPIVGEPK